MIAPILSALPTLEPSRSDNGARGHLTRSQRLLRRGRTAEALAAASAARRRAVGHGDAAVLADVQHALVALIAGERHPVERLDDSAVEAVARGRPPRDAALVTRSVVALWDLTGRSGPALALVQHLVDVARASVDPSVLAVPLEMAGRLLLGRGEVASAQARLGEALGAYDLSAPSTFPGTTHAARALLAAQMGHRPACMSEAQRALDPSCTIERTWIEMHVNRALGLLALGEGRFDLAVDHLDKNRMLAAAARVVLPTAVRWEGDFLLALIGAGHRHQAWQALDELEDASERTRSTWGWSVSLRARALLEPARAEAAVRDAIALQADLPFEQACSRLVLGEHLRRSGRMRDARVELTTAARLFAACAALRWRDRAESGLRATGVRRAPRGADRRELTEQERQVALAVTGGATNREAAASLFLSEKTVEYHLGKVFRKLGVANRTQLAGCMLRQVPA